MTAVGKAAQIPDALLARVASLSVGSPALPIAMPDVPFDPTVSATDGKYLEVAYLANRPAWEGVGNGVVDQGLLQITVVYPSGHGVIAPNEAAEEVKAHFTKGLPLVSGTTRVKITAAPWAAAPLIDPSETRVPVTIPWAA
jgi:hypothetical protein